MMTMTVTLTITDAQAALLQRALEDALDRYINQFDELCDDGAKDGELQSVRRLYLEAADLNNTLERRLRVAPPTGKDSA